MSVKAGIQLCSPHLGTPKIHKKNDGEHIPPQLDAPSFPPGSFLPLQPHSLKPVPRLARAGYGAVVGAAVDPGAAMELKEDGVPWNVPMLKDGGRVFTVWDATCCKRGKIRERKRRPGFTPTLSSGRRCQISPKGGSTWTHSAAEWKQDGSPRRAGSGRQRGARACT